MTSPSTLITSDRVRGTEVKSRDGAGIGEIDHLVIDKVSGKVAYAVMKFGGFMGLKGDFYPIPWALLTYDTGKEAYVANISEAKVKAAPEYDPGSIHDEREARKIHNHYDVPFYWKEHSPLSM